MLKFSDLSASQKKFVVAAMNLNPSVKKNPEMTRKEILDAFNTLYAQRGSSNEKIGFPNWLCNANKIGRGKYQLPVPTDAELKDFSAAISAPKTKKVKASATKKVVAKKVATTDTELEKSRLQNIIDESEVVEDYSSDQEFLDELRANGINV